MLVMWKGPRRDPRAYRLRGSHQDELLIARLGPSSHRVGADLS
jgi:hypothetical protein